MTQGHLFVLLPPVRTVSPSEAAVGMRLGWLKKTSHYVLLRKCVTFCYGVS